MEAVSRGLHVVLLLICDFLSKKNRKKARFHFVKRIIFADFFEKQVIRKMIFIQLSSK